MKKLLMVVTAMAALSMLSVRAHAACIIGSIAEVARVEYNADINLATIYLRASSLSAASFFATTADPNFIVLASDAVHTRTKVSVTGNAATCPASGNIGVVTFFGVDPE